MQTAKTPWPEKVIQRFKKYGDIPQLIFMVPDITKRTRTPSPLLVLPTGAGFDTFLPLAFLPDNENGNGNAPPNGDQPVENQNTEGDADNGSNQNSNNTADNDTTNGNNGGNAGTDSGTGNGNTPSSENTDQSPFDDWPPVDEEAWDREINEALDKALEEAYGEDDGQSAPEDPDRIRLRYGRRTPIFGVPDDWWKIDPDISPHHPEPFDEHFGPPKWEDLEEDYRRPPYWPPDMEWPPRRFPLPGEWRPFEKGIKLGGWKIHITPIWPWK